MELSQKNYEYLFNIFPLKGIIDNIPLDINTLLRAKKMKKNFVNYNKDYYYSCINLICEIINKNIEIEIDHYLIDNDPYDYLLNLIDRFEIKNKPIFLSKLLKETIEDYDKDNISDTIKSLHRNEVFCCDTLKCIKNRGNFRYRSETLKLVSMSPIYMSEVILRYTGFLSLEDLESVNLRITGAKYFDLDKLKTVNKRTWSKKQYKHDDLKIVSNNETRFNFIVSNNEIKSVYIPGTRNLDKKKKKNDIELQRTRSVKKKRRAIPKGIRDMVWRKHCGNVLDGVCFCCGNELRNERWECGHILADACGGTVTMDNLRPTCINCNRSMGKRHMFVYMKKYYPFQFDDLNLELPELAEEDEEFLGNIKYR